MMEHSEETLSTRDLASSSGEAGARQPSRETATGVDDKQEAPRVGRTGAAPASDGEAAIDAPRVDQAGSPASPTEVGSPASAAEVGSPASAAEVGSPASAAGTSDRAPGANAPLLPADVTSTFQERWEEVQTRFVDEPRGAVEDADGLVANLMQQLAEGFAQERERLEAQWGRGEDISTEDLRVALQRYRSFFQRLLAT
jgi:hypothetical protein